MDSLENTTRISFLGAVNSEGKPDEATVDFNEDFADFTWYEEIYFRVPFEHIQIIYKAMCDKRFEAKEKVYGFTVKKI